MSTDEKSTQQVSRLTAWSERNKFRVQVTALVLALGAPFGLYGALNAGQDVLAAGCFVLVTLSMAVVVWIS